jgi:hypothetical protein
MADLLVRSGNRYANKFLGAGIYAIYYTGSFAPYAPVAEKNRRQRFEAPLYVGKAVPEGARKGGIVDTAEDTDALFERLKIHAQTIEEVSNLDLADFFFRYLVVDDIWIPLGETYMIQRFQPVWNMRLDGFGNKTPGIRRREQVTSLWDTLHPGRRYVERLELAPNPKSAKQIRAEIEEYFSMTEKERANLPVLDDGEQ